MKILRLIRQTGRPRAPSKMAGFDGTYYLYWYKDIESYGGTPLDHYLTIGWKEGRDPSAGFSTDGYLAAHADVRENGANPLIHFLRFGLAEGRRGWEKDPHAPPPRPRVLAREGARKPLSPPASE